MGEMNVLPSLSLVLPVRAKIEPYAEVRLK